MSEIGLWRKQLIKFTIEHKMRDKFIVGTVCRCGVDTSRCVWQAWRDGEATARYKTVRQANFSNESDGKMERVEKIRVSKNGLDRCQDFRQAAANGAIIAGINNAGVSLGTGFVLWAWIVLRISTQSLQNVDNLDLFLIEVGTSQERSKNAAK